MTPRKSRFSTFLTPLLLAAVLVPSLGAQPETVLDLLDVNDGDQLVRRIYGHDGSGATGVPVAGGHDMDGDGRPETAVGYMTTAPVNALLVGEVYLVFGTSLLDGSLDSAAGAGEMLTFTGTADRETTGSEIWMDDVTGDGLGDLLICRQNYTLGNRCGIGALSVVAGSKSLRDAAEGGQPISLDAPPPGVVVTTVVGRASGDRFCIWARTGDVDGDDVADIAIGADQEDGPGEEDRGALYVLRGGAHLASGSTFDLAQWGNGGAATARLGGGHPLDGLLAKILPPPGSAGYHLGGTCQIADLDGDGRAEVLGAATINRAGAAIRPQTGGSCSGSFGTSGSGGSPRGTVYIAWADNFPAAPMAWPAGYTFEITASPGSRTVIDGEPLNESFGEEILGGGDLDGDGEVDLFLGDLIVDGTPQQDRPVSGYGHILFNAGSLKDLSFAMDSPPQGLAVTRILGPESGAIAADTAAEGDFDGDGRADLAVASPHANPQDRESAGEVHLLFGRVGAWPAVVDLADGAQPSPASLRIAEIHGARGDEPFADTGDTLGYSAAAADLDGDGRSDLIINEMVGNGLQPGTLDVGNLILISGRAFDPALLFADGFESGDFTRWALP